MAMLLFDTVFSFCLVIVLNSILFVFQTIVSLANRFSSPWGPSSGRNNNIRNKAQPSWLGSLFASAKKRFKYCDETKLVFKDESGNAKHSFSRVLEEMNDQGFVY